MPHDSQSPAAIDDSPAEQVRFSGVFRSPELEARYREQQLPHDIARARLLALIALPGYVVFAATDYLLFGISWQFGGLIAVRLAMVASTVGFIMLAPRCRGPRVFDWLLFATTLLTAIGSDYVVSTRPHTYVGWLAVTAIAVFSIYTLVPLPLALQSIPALIVSFGSALPFMKAGSAPDLMAATAILTAYSGANLLGFVASRDLQGWKRRQFATLLREQQAREGLERAMAEIRTLRGILPICAHCTRIRDEEGDWKRVDVYVRDHTHAEFSHSICPDCAEEHYGRSARTGDAVRGGG